MHKRMGYRKTVKNKCVKQFTKFPLTHICTSILPVQFTLHICKRNADWFSNNIQPINIDFNRSLVDCGPRFVVSC